MPADTFSFAALHSTPEAIGLLLMINKLRPQNRTMVILAYVKGYKMQQVGKLPGLPINTVKTRLRRALVELREFYAVASVVAGEAGSISSNASVTITALLPLNPANISVSSVEKKVKLSWDNPADTTVKTIKVYRAAVNGEFKMIEELAFDKTEYIDTNVDSNTTYFYALSVTNIKNKESRKTDAVGIKVN